MKRVLLLVLLILTGSLSGALCQSDEIAVPEQVAEQFAETNGDETDLSELDDRYLELLRRPLNLNKCNEAELVASGLFSLPQAHAIINHRSRFGPFISVYELQAIDILSRETIRALIPFVATGNQLNAPNATYGRMIREGRHQVVVRMQLVPEPKAGFNNRYGSPAYEGSPLAIYIKYRFQYSGKLSWGFIAEKDAGEALFSQHAKNGFDFYSYHLAVRDLKPFKIIVLGDYKLEYGQGLTLNTGLSGGIPADPMQLIQTGFGILPYTSSNEFSFKRGAAVSLESKRIGLDLFGSVRSLDGNLYGSNDSIVGNEWISSFQETGYHRTFGEILDKGAVTEKLAGSHLGYKSRSLRTGITIVASWYSLPVIKNPYLYNRFEFRGNALAGAGWDYDLLFRNFHFSGEISSSDNKSIAMVHHVVISVHPAFGVALSFRNYPRDFHNLNNGSMRQSGNNYNERGIFAGMNFRLSRTISINSSIDRFNFPWCKYQVDGPSEGYEFSGMFTWTPSKKTSIYCRYRNTMKYSNAFDVSEAISQLERVRQRGLRIHISSKISRSFTIRTRVERTWYNEGSKSSGGFLIFQDLLFKPLSSRFSGNVRYGLFDTDNYDSRIYAYENDVPGGYSIPAYYYKGYRVNANLHIRLSETIDFWMRYAVSVYDNRKTIGSGLDEIDGNKKSEFKWQLRFEF